MKKEMPSYLPITSNDELITFTIKSGKLEKLGLSKFEFHDIEGRLYDDLFIPDGCDIITFVKTCSKCNYKKGRLQLSQNLSEENLIYSIIPNSTSLTNFHVKVIEEELLDKILEGYKIKKNSSGFVGLNPDKYGVFTEFKFSSSSKVTIKFPILISKERSFFAVFNGSFLYYLSSKRKI